MINNIEYTTYFMEGTATKEEWDEILNQHASEGWELVKICPQVASDSDFAMGDVDLDITCCSSVFVEYNIMVFKRVKE